jgi:hypothetical protein
MLQKGVELPTEQPQVRASISGVAIPGVISLEVISVGYFSADRFRIGFAIGASSFTTMAYFSRLGMQAITIEVALNDFGYVMLLIGQVDNIRVDLLTNNVFLTGRDLSARLIDSEISETFVNQTASQIANMLAARHQLIPNVTTTATSVGQYYELDHARNSLGVHSQTSTEWNLLAALAQAENFNLSVTGGVLNFGPLSAGIPILVTPQNFMGLSLDIAASLPTGAMVKSWDSRNKVVVSGSSGNGMSTTLIRPNLTSAQAQTMAENHLAVLGGHGTILCGKMPGDLTMMPGMQLVLSGTNSPFDQSYTVVEVSRSLTGRTGFVQNIRASVAA